MHATNVLPWEIPKIWECNICDKHVTQVLSNTTWAHMNYHEPQTHAQILDQIFWYNSHVKKNRKIF